ncbi:hypothetical protein SAMN04515647_0454 [Cohaesibacter sp. ES.047]|nr:hypothetical protein SAMN04515647_0454 [Cohaesibacter sp. ES.047]
MMRLATCCISASNNVGLETGPARQHMMPALIRIPPPNRPPLGFLTKFDQAYGAAFHG